MLSMGCSRTKPEFSSLTPSISSIWLTESLWWIKERSLPKAVTMNWWAMKPSESSKKSTTSTKTIAKTPRCRLKKVLSLKKRRERNSPRTIPALKSKVKEATQKAKKRTKMLNSHQRLLLKKNKNYWRNLVRKRTKKMEKSCRTKKRRLSWWPGQTTSMLWETFMATGSTSWLSLSCQPPVIPLLSNTTMLLPSGPTQSKTPNLTNSGNISSRCLWAW